MSHGHVVHRYDDPNVFHDHIKSYLLADECQNNLIISILMRVVENPGHYGDASSLYMAAAGTDEETLGVFLRTPPHNLIVSRSDSETLEAVAKDCAADSLPGVLGPKDAAQAFAGHYCRLSGRKWRLRTAERTFKLERVTPPAPVDGHLRQAGEDDLALLTDWTQSFINDCHLANESHDSAKMARRSLDSGGWYIWDNNGPVSMAAANRHTPSGTNVGLVYTPSELRGRGYASACVAALSQKILDDGKRFCFLFTDLSNPTSNKIYQAMGYQEIADFDEIEFYD